MDEKVKQYIGKQKSPQKEICQKLRQVIFDLFPNIEEEMKWGVPAYGNGKYYIVALKDHVNYGYNDGTKKMKHLEIFSPKDIHREEIINLLKLAKKKHK